MRTSKRSARRRADQPTDLGVDRRAFIERMAALTSVAALGGASLPSPLSGLESADAVVPSSRPFTKAPPPAGLAGSMRPAPSFARSFDADLWLPPTDQIAFDDPSELTVAEAAALIREGELRPSALVEACLARIREYDATYLAFNAVTAETAEGIAARMDNAPWRGPLHGIPLAIKDNYYTAGVLTTANSFIFEDFVPEFDATSWARLKSEGGILVGKTQMGPLATSRATTPTGDNTTVNAWAPGIARVSPGGSSSGSATAVAARLALSSTGTQTGGSITNPSLQQGLTGIKPTMGRVSLYGVIPLTYTRDHPGPLARDAADAAIMLQAMAGPDPRDPRSLGLPAPADYTGATEPVDRAGRPAVRWPTTIGVWPGYTDIDDSAPQFGPSGGSEAEVEARAARRARRRAAEAAARTAMLARFEELGARIVEIEPPPDWDTLTSRTFNNVRLPERSEPFLEVLKRDVREFGVSLSPWINGLLLSGTEYLRGQRAKMLLLQQVVDGVFNQCDAVVQTSPIPFDMIGLPLIAFPIGFEDSEGVDLPMGAVLGGLPYSEDRLLSLAAAYQRVTDWHRRAPAAPDLSGGTGGPLEDRGRTGILDVEEFGQ